ncbi:restriction endonuclease subunit S [Nonomuraea angiospora]|uniref:restriction endonuclease subunit S n=1 Tax=Nonomuraea angiospora TaxID=46172 RepID=UPI0037A299DD
MRELPEGWKSLRLRDAGIWLSGGTPSTDEPRFWGGDIPWISAASMKNFYVYDSDRRLTKSGSSAGTRIVGRGSVLFVVRGMSLKKEFRVGVTQRELAFGQDCKAIIPRQDIDGTFLALALKVRTGEILSMVDEAGHGTGRLPTDMVSRLEIGIPPLSEQRRITEILETLDSAIARSQSHAEKLNVTLTGLKRKLLADLTAEPGSSVIRYFDIKAGITLGPDRVPRNNGTPYLRVANVQRERIDLEDIALLYASAAERLELALRTGDLLVVEGHANPDEIGRCARVPPEASGTLYQNHLFRLRSEHTDPEFAEIWLNSESARSYWRRMCATSSGLYTINSKMLAALPFPALHRDEQVRISKGPRDVQQQITTERASLDKLRSIKQGLMEDLLTGRVQVSEAEAALENL